VKGSFLVPRAKNGFGIYLFYTSKNGMKKPQKPCGVWGSATGIYFGHLMWLE
jgi:hypothetical protein